MERFLQRAADILDVDSVTPDTRFREVPGWCSLMAFGLLVMMENDYSRELSIEEFMRIETLGQLFSRISS
jgi:acyl carrier protein